MSLMIMQTCASIYAYIDAKHDEHFLGRADTHVQIDARALWAHTTQRTLEIAGVNAMGLQHVGDTVDTLLV